MSLEPLLTVQELATLLRTSRAAILQARYRGADLPPGIRIGRRVLFRPEDVRAWLDENTENNAQPGEATVSGPRD